jgi:Sensors of blue-light using FAD
VEYLYQIVYTSTASVGFGKAELTELLKGSVRRNKQAGITGLLLYKDGMFMQALEGEDEAVLMLFEKICRDSRHHHIIPLLREPIKRRNFPNFSMAFRDLNVLETRKLPGYSQFLNTPLNGELLANDIPKCKRLLLHFKKSIR